MAVGEAACVSVHGANRLGSNALIDSWCSAAPPASAAPKPSSRTAGAELPNELPTRRSTRLDEFRHAHGRGDRATARRDAASHADQLRGVLAPAKCGKRAK